MNEGPSVVLVLVIVIVLLVVVQIMILVVVIVIVVVVVLVACGGRGSRGTEFLFNLVILFPPSPPLDRQ